MLKILFLVIQIEVLVLSINTLLAMAELIYQFSWYLGQFLYLPMLEQLNENVAMTARLLTDRLEEILSNL